MASTRNPSDKPVNGRLDRACAAYDQGDFVNAFADYFPVAQEGDAVAQTMIGWMYERGLGTAINTAEAEKWYRLAAAQDYDEGCVLLAQLMDATGRVEEATVNYEKAANLGNLAAAYRLGAFSNRYKTDGTFWLEKAATAEHVFAAVLLGRRMMARHIAGGAVTGMLLVIRAVWRGIKIIYRSRLTNAWDDPRLSR